MSGVNRYSVKSEDVNAGFYESTGSQKSNRLFVLIHGFMSWSYSFESLIPHLKPAGHVLTLDLPGFGLSKKNLKYHYSYEQYTKTVSEMIERLDIEFSEVIVIGHSMGGQVAMRLALNMTKVRAIVLLASSGDMTKSPARLRLASHLPFFNLWLARYVRDRDVNHVLKQVIHDKGKITEDQIEAYKRPLQENLMFSALAKFIRHREGDLTRDTLQTITQPVLILWGESDRIVPVRVGRYLEKELNNAELKVYPNVGHLLPEEIPDVIAKEITRFVDG